MGRLMCRYRRKETDSRCQAKPVVAAVGLLFSPYWLLRVYQALSYLYRLHRDSWEGPCPYGSSIS